MNRWERLTILLIGSAIGFCLGVVSMIVQTIIFPYN